MGWDTGHSSKQGHCVAAPHPRQGTPTPRAVRLASTYSVLLTGLVADQAHLAEKKRGPTVAVLCCHSLDRFVLPSVQCSPTGPLALHAAPWEQLGLPGGGELLAHGSVSTIT